MRVPVNVREYKNAPPREMDIRCFFGIHAYTKWTYRDGQPPMYKVCTRCGMWEWHRESWDALHRYEWPEKDAK